MAIRASQISAVNTVSGEVLIDGRMNQVFADAAAGSGITYGWVEIRNSHPTLSWSAGKAWFGLDITGAVVSIAMADSTVRAFSYAYSPLPSVPASFSIPTDYAGGITIPTLTPASKILLCVKRDCTSAAAVSPEQNRLYVQGTSPA